MKIFMPAICLLLVVGFSFSVKSQDTSEYEKILLQVRSARGFSEATKIRRTLDNVKNAEIQYQVGALYAGGRLVYRDVRKAEFFPAVLPNRNIRWLKFILP